MKKLIIALIIMLTAIIWTGCKSDETTISIPKPTEAQYTDKYGVGYNEDENGNLTTASFKNKEKDIVIPSELNGREVKSIGKSSFKMSKAETVTIPDTVEEIQDYAFAFSRTLKKIIIPDSVKSIGTNAFSGCTKLKTIKLPKKLKTIGIYSFDASGLKNVTIPKSVENIMDYAFAECDNLKNVTFNGKKTKIADSAFDKSVYAEFTAPKNSKAIAYAKEKAIDYKYK